MGKDAPKSNLGSTNPHDHVGLLYDEAIRIKRAHPHLGIETEDYVSEMYPYLCNCCRTFDKSKGFQISTLIVASLRKARPEIITRVKHGSVKNSRNTKRRDFYNSIQRLNESFAVRMFNPYTEHERALDWDTLSSMLHNIDERSVEIFIRNIGQGETLRSIGNDFGISKERVRQVRTRVIEKLRQIAEDRKL